MSRALGEISIATADGLSFRRITEEEGWESGYLRAVALHETTGRTVLVSAYQEGKLTPKVEISTREGALCVHNLQE